MEKIIAFLKSVDFEKFDIILNIGGTVLILGKEIIEILEKQGTMTNIEYIKIADKANMQAEIERARLVKLIEES